MGSLNKVRVKAAQKRGKMDIIHKTGQERVCDRKRKRGYTMEIKWKELGIEDEGIIQHYYDMEPVRNCEFTYANNFLWAPFYDIQYAVVEDMLVFLSGEAGLSVSFPLGKGDLGKTVDVLTEFFKEKEMPFHMYLELTVQF